jgi:hypothetical protein
VKATDRDPPNVPDGRKLTSTPDWLVGTVIKFVGMLPPRLCCRQCDELLCTVEQKDSLWILADVVRDHRKWCRSDEELGR